MVSTLVSHCKDVNYNPVSVDKWKLYVDDISLSFLCSSMEICYTCWYGQVITTQVWDKVYFLSCMEDCAFAYSLVFSNFADHWNICSWGRKRKASLLQLNWNSEVDRNRHFPLIKDDTLGWIGKREGQWLETKGKVAADLGWSSFALHICLVLRCYVHIEWFCGNIERLFHIWARWVQKEEKGVMFSESVFPNGRVLLILLKWVRLDLECRTHVLKLYSLPSTPNLPFTKSERNNSIY